MRFIFAALLAGAALAPAARAGDLRNFDDAALHAIQFVDRDEGWAAGDEGVVWHTIDGGKTWERQPTGVRASLRSLHFLNPYTGWVVGREEQPHGGGSTGVLLFTRDGGLKWQQVHVNALPGLNKVRFTDNRTGFIAGDGTDQYATGVFQTSDSGRSWQPLPGPRCPGWLAADFQDAQIGALAGTWSRMAMVRHGSVAMADLDTLGGRSLRGLQIVGERAVAVGQGGVVLLSDKTAGGTWQLANLKLPAEVLAGWDFHAVHCVGGQMWVVGRPGSVVLHSADLGITWDIQTTQQPVPLNGVFFSDDVRGWAVGELGSILATADGGKTWQVQHRGGQRAAVLFIQANAADMPLDTVALLGGEEGYLAAAVRVVCSDPASSAFGRAGESQRFASAIRQAAGAAGETLWQFPALQHQATCDKAELLRSWDERLHAGKTAEQLLRQLVLAFRIWRPEVVITGREQTNDPASALVVEAVNEAFARAMDPNAFPEQITQLGLQPWKAAKLYAHWDGGPKGACVYDLNDVCNRLESTPRDFAAPAAALLSDVPRPLPTERSFRLLNHRIEGLADRDLMGGVRLAPDGVARRHLEPLGEANPEIATNIRTRRNFQALAEMPAGGLADPNKLLSQIGSSLAGLPDDQAAPAAFAAASQYARLGQWTLAREAYLLMVDRYPAHPLAADAYRWLIRHNSSSEARRRHELGQFLALTQVEINATPKKAGDPPSPGPRTKEEEAAARAKKNGVPDSEVEISHQRALVLLGSMAETRRWYQGSLEIEPRLAAFGSLFATDPSIQFPLQAARRNLGDFDTPKKWYADFMAKHKDGPWRENAAAELWLTNRSGPPPKPVAACRQTSSRPFLDGNFDDACWQNLRPITLRNAVGDTVKDYPTQAWLAYDKDFLYLALRCRHPADRYVEPVKRRTRDADLNAYDRVSLLLDLDRDYSTCFHLQIDQRGCLREECWGDPAWNPRWFVAAKSDAESWQVEAAIPMAELTGDTVTLGHAWACNVVRILPGRGVQAMSTPADVLPRPEGMGLLIFTQDPARSEPAARNMQPETGAAGGR